MGKVTFRTAGETHGPALVAIVEGIPAGVPLKKEDVDRDLARRQGGYGRGGRMKIERDEAELLSGVRFGRTLGSPVSLLLRNRDWENWRERMAREGEGRGVAAVTTARPGHADLPGALKYGTGDVRNVLERASARETAARVMAGAVAKALLAPLGVEVAARVLSVGAVALPRPAWGDYEGALKARAEGDLLMGDAAAEVRARRAIDRARKEGTTLGGTFEVLARGLPPGIGSHVSWESRLDGRLAMALVSIPAVKGAEVGDGFLLASLPGRDAMDEIFPGPAPGGTGGREGLPFHRLTNRAGGIEGGITNGETVVVRGAMKPIPTQMAPLRTVELGSFAAASAHTERSDTCAVAACAVVAEAMVALVLADAFLDKFGGDSLKEIQYNQRRYRKGISAS
jgi:chorismate synthase